MRVKMCNETRLVYHFLINKEIPPMNMRPIGPHPIGSYEVWAPKEYFAHAMSFFMLNRDELSILVHPLTRCADHFAPSVLFSGAPPPIFKS